VLLVSLLGLVAAELLLRWRQAAIQGSDRLDPGFIRYDPRLGWRLTPGWRGAHRHHDFAVRYAINESGYRSDPALPADRRGRLIAVVGDSFTFGLGVNDGETFVSLLNRDGPNSYLNLSIPGFSTDQQALLIEDELPRLRPDEVWLAVYVGNDLLDNQFARPIQLNAAKPYFVLTTNGLELVNVSAPSVPNSGRQPPPDLATVVLGESAPADGLGTRIARRFALGRMVCEAWLPIPDYNPTFEARFRGVSDVFDAILARVQGTCSQARVELRVLVLAGRSCVEEPQSLSAQYQHFFARHVLAVCGRRGIPAHDLMTALRRNFEKTGARYFYPNDGHLTPLGHAVIHQALGGMGSTIPRRSQ